MNCSHLKLAHSTRCKILSNELSSIHLVFVAGLERSIRAATLCRPLAHPPLCTPRTWSILIPVFGISSWACRIKTTVCPMLFYTVSTIIFFFYFFGDFFGCWALPQKLHRIARFEQPIRAHLLCVCQTVALLFLSVHLACLLHLMGPHNTIVCPRPDQTPCSCGPCPGTWVPA